MKMKNLVSLFLAVILCLSSVLVSPASAEEAETATLTEVEILYAPLKSRITYDGFTDLSDMVLELSFSDGTTKKEVVYLNGNVFKAGEYEVFFEPFALVFEGDPRNYGARIVPFEIIKDYEHASTSHATISVPTPIEIIAMFENFIININNPFWDFDELFYFRVNSIKAFFKTVLEGYNPF